VHPIERLRYVARASGAPQAALVQETASALSSFADDPHSLITACRRVVSRQPSSGPLLWFAARVVTASDPFAEVWQASGELQADTTAAALVRALPDDATVCVIGWPAEVAEALPRRGDVGVFVVDALQEGSGFTNQLWQVDVDADDVPMGGLGAAVACSTLVLLESNAIGPDEFLAVSGSRAAAAVARHAGIPVWLVGGVGRILPARMWEGLRARLDCDEPWDADDEVVPLDLVDQIVGPDGPEAVDVALRRCDCPVATELFKGVVVERTGFEHQQRAR
jgi:hypothetical protein